MEYVAYWVNAPLQVTTDRENMVDQHHVDRAGLCTVIEEYCNKLDGEGYEVVSIFPTISGIADSFRDEDPDLKWDIGYSVTDGAIITGRRKRR